MKISKKLKFVLIASLFMFSVVAVATTSSAASAPALETHLNSVHSDYYIIAALYDVYDVDTVQTIGDMNTGMGEAIHEKDADEVVKQSAEVIEAAVDSYKGVALLENAGDYFDEYSIRAVTFYLVNKANNEFIQKMTDVRPMDKDSYNLEMDNWKGDVMASFWMNWYTHYIKTGTGGDCLRVACLSPW